MAVEAAHADLLPPALLADRRTMGVVRVNPSFTMLYNKVGLTLAAAQSLPDLGILGNSSRLLK